MGRALPNATGGVTVLAYHLVGAGTDAAVDLPSHVFERHLDELPSCGRVVALAEALGRLRGETDDRDGHWIVLTFDDAFRNFVERAWPALDERRLPATLYVPSGFVDGTSPSPLQGAGELPPMAWRELREVASSGLITVGSHSVSHPDLRTLDDAACRAELAASRARIEEQLGKPVESFCYPRALSSRRVRAQTAQIYDHAVARGGRRNRVGRWDSHRISRLPLRRDMPSSLSELVAKEIWLEEWAATTLAGWRA